ncbi:type IV secretion system DNA-binding domain-containing protein [Sulfurimonas sp. NW15]|uniref:type IV secretory system conjugative DNA transfer family protein n=1 Tax=Sulfurimonas sp. NW15 TaxID=2922729 RepID=UPI003DA99BAA
MMNNHFTGSHLPANVNANKSFVASKPIFLDTVQAELVNEELEYQNQRFQKNLIQHESLVHRHWRNENDKQIIVNNEWNKYNSLIQNEQSFLFNNRIARDGDVFYYQPNPNHKVISGTKEEIELEVSSRNPFNLCFVDDLNDIKGIRFDTVHISIKSIPVLSEQVYDPNNSYGMVNYFNEISQNDFIPTEYLYERFNDCSLEKEPSPVLYVIQNLTTYKDHAFLANRMGKHFKNLKSDNTLVLIHNRDVADVIWSQIITKIYGEHNVKVLSDEILNTQSVEDILDKTLCIRVNSIPDDFEKQERLKQLITSVSISYDRVQLYITLDEAHPILEEFLSATDIIFLDSIQNIIEKLKARDKINLLKQIDSNLMHFAKELSVIGLNPLNENNYDNNVEKQKYLNLISEIDSNNISKNELLNPFDGSIDRIIPLEARYKHMMITGQTGSGKSELAKSLIYNDVERNDGVVILLEPHGDLAEQVAKLPIERKRLVYIDLTLHENMTPSMNLFYLVHKNEKEIQARAKVIVSVVKTVNDTEKFTGAMEDVLYNVVCVLLRAGKSDFFEVLRYLSAKEKDLLQLGQHSPNMLEKEFFVNDFETIKPTRDAVKRRIKKLLNDPLLANLFNGDCTFDLEQLMNERGKVLIFRIQKSEMLDSYAYYARFILGLIQTIALKRARIKEADRVPTYCYIDEFHNFITSTIEEILTESRKYALYMTLINQSVSQIKNSALRDIILSNTNVKVIGNNSNKTLDTMNNTLNTKLTDVEKLPTGEFYLSIGNGDIVKVKNSDALLSNNVNISPSEWSELKHYQLEHYYRSTKSVDITLSDSELEQKINEFIMAIFSRTISYFDKVKSNQELYNELIYNFNDNSLGALGYISKQDLYLYFNLVHNNNYFENNKKLLKLLRKDDFFTQKVDDNKTYNGKKRLKIT